MMMRNKEGEPFFDIHFLLYTIPLFWAYNDREEAFFPAEGTLSKNHKLKN